ncbi:MAG: Glu/Leu/Phe/Val dehydrogenase [Gammaproteobacteria bacterium]|nr:Glu/Leu/Phe/Val dehydrogenase [Gammaproteobacteria bacterium]MCW8928140.1 Glu/Leu/Phe/Val dehydrogenase [Gammaproteobacteria bacterium]MCW8957994.1 Glu/Leu/Phe/Val dehydrogenase [Gammaproteobacteria bacterium]MCW8972962.1 Glu/Leu/Phe/Val dehydrogenase [Gammaproteobacteria bacterium]MCW8992991.1 Glu/Leu/Phe/Val dehydrogenase [Gammaproteobacteria bacterium]
MYDFLEQSTRLMHQAAEVAELDPAVVELLSAPGRVVSFRIPLKMDDGSCRIFDAYRVRYNDALGPSRDGTRISADLDVEECKALALIMSVKHAAGLIPAGGGKGGITCNPRELSKLEFERLCRAYIRYLRPSGPDYDVLGADIGTDLQSMAWMLDEYEQISGRHAPAAINDKPPIIGGTLGGYEATGRGVFDVFREAADETGFEINGTRVVVQGFGQVGSVAAQMFAEAGCRVIAISDSRGGVYCEEGLDVAALLEHKQQSGRVADFPGTTPLTNTELLETECDVLVPAALQGVITEENAPNIRTQLLVEAANGPTTLEADALLMERGITIVPDVLANAGSVHLCQMERTQGLSDDYWDLETINRLRRKRLVGGYRAAVNTAARYNLASARLGAWINALKRIEEAIKTRGWC